MLKKGNKISNGVVSRKEGGFMIITNGNFQFDPDKYAKYYAQENDITVDKAKEKLEEKFGAPEENSSNFNFISQAQKDDNKVDARKLDISDFKELSKEMKDL